MKKTTLPLIAVLGLLSWQSSNAGIIEVNFDATVNHVGSLLAGDGIGVGDSVTGTFLYDLTSADSNGDPNRGSYTGLSFSLTIDGITLSSSSSSIRTQNDLQNGSATNPADGMTNFASIQNGSLNLNGYDATSFQFGVYRDIVTTGQLWGDDLLPDLNDWANINVADINAADWHWLAFDTGPTSGTIDDIRWEINSFSASKVPEPSALALFILGFTGFGVARIRSKKHR